MSLNIRAYLSLPDSDSNLDTLTTSRAIQSPTSPLPPAFLTHKVLPSLLHSLSLPSTSSTSASALLPLVLSLGKLVPPADYTKLVLEPVVKLYQSPDRGTRMALLEGLGEYESKMDNRCVQEKVWPHLVSLFALLFGL